MKYIYFIPQGGLSDCLHCLGEAVRYARQTHRVLLYAFAAGTYKVDFAEYFQLRIPNVVHDQKSISRTLLQRPRSVYPSCLADKLPGLAAGAVHPVGDAAGCFRFMGIALGYPAGPVREDVLVVSVCGGGDATPMFMQLSLTPLVQAHCRRCLAELGPRYLAIQVRNTDYRCDYKSLYRQHRSLIHSYEVVLVATDDQNALEFFRDQGLNVHNFAEYPDGEYTSLHTADVDPHRRMLSLLADIFAVVNADVLLSNSKGLFIQLLRRLREHKHVTLRKLSDGRPTSNPTHTSP
jgi:hypothetical protein